MNCTSCGRELEPRGSILVCPLCTASLTRQPEPNDNAAFMSDDVTVGQLVRWVNGEIVRLARANPMDMPRMKSLADKTFSVEELLALYRAPR